MTQTEKQRMMVEAPIPGLIARLSIPTIISMLTTSFYNMADTYFVGQIGTSATAAVGVVFPLMSIIQALGFFFGHGCGNSVSRKLGAQKYEEAEHLASCGFFLALFSGACILALGQLFLEPLSRLLGSTDTILPYTKQYMGVILLGAPYMTAAFVLNNLLRFQGSAFYAMVGITSGGILNIILDPIFIFVFGLGIAGAAWATILSQFIAFVLLYVGMRRANCIPLRIRHLRRVRETFGQIFGGGLPSLCRQGLGSLATVALNLAAKPYGDAAIAAMSIVQRITFFAGSTVIGFGQGFQPVCGFNYGAGNIRRVKEAFWFCVKTATAVLLVLGVLGFLFSGDLVRLFRRDDLEVIAIGTLALRLQCAALPLTGWIILNNMLFQTIGYTVPASVLAAARQGIFFLPAVLILPLFFQILGIQMAQAAADVGAFVLALILNRRLLPKLK